jgi:hypothetical protein
VFLALLLLSLVSAAGLLGVPAARAQGGQIEVTEEGVESHFPDDIRFFLSARGPEEIHEVRVYFKRSSQTSGSSYRALTITPGTSVSGEAVIRVGLGNGYIPPGTEYQYYFEVRDRGQRVLRTPSKTFLYEDTRLQWRTVTHELITVYYSGGVTEARAQTVLEASREALDRMKPVLGIEPTRPLRIVAYGSYQDMSGALPFRARAVEEQLVTEGQAFTEERVLLVLASGTGSDLRGITAHEFAHLLVAEAAGKAVARVPAWLNEGLAEYANPVPSDSYEQALRRAIDDGRLRPLWHLTAFGGTPEDIIIGYGHASSVVDYLVSTYGQAKVAEVFRAIQTTLDIDRALEQVYGFDQYGVDAGWRQSVGLQPLPPRQTAEPSPTPGAAPTPSAGPASTPAAPGATAVPPAPPNTPTSRPVPPGAAGCNGTAADLAWLALLGAVAGMLVAKRRRRGLGGA